MIAEHPEIGTVILIVSGFYAEKQNQSRRILLLSNDNKMQGPAAILRYKRRWRIEVWFKAIKPQMRIGTFQLRKVGSIVAHFQLRGIFSLRLNVVRRCGFVHRSHWTLRKVTRWLRDALMVQKGLKAV